MSSRSSSHGFRCPKVFMRLADRIVRRLFPPPRRRAGREISAAELARRVEHIALAARRRTDAAHSGSYRAVFQGRGMEFSEVRDYRPGDDIRTIDWNVTARAGTPYVKLFQEERDRTVMLIADLSASQDFGSQLATKRDLTSEAAAAIALSAAGNRDRVGAILLTDRIEKIHRPARGRGHALAIVSDILSMPLANFETRLSTGLRAAAQILKSQALVVILSDFRDIGYQQELGRLARRHDVVAIATTDPAETNPSARGLMRVVDAETRQSRVVDFSSLAIRKAFSRAPLAIARQICRETGVDYLELSTSRAPARDLGEFFHERSRPRRGAVAGRGLR